MSSKKLLVVSDSHGDTIALKAIFDWAKTQLPPAGTIYGACFLGDGISDLSRAARASGFYSDWKIVRGNNDYEPSIPETMVIDFADHCFFICHGHRYSLYNGYHSLLAAGRNANADVVLFGHSHVPCCKKENNMWIINPGSIALPRNKIGATFAVIECSEKAALTVEFWGINDNNKISKIKFEK